MLIDFIIRLKITFSQDPSPRLKIFHCICRLSKILSIWSFSHFLSIYGQAYIAQQSISNQRNGREGEGKGATSSKSVNRVFRQQYKLTVLSNIDTGAYKKILAKNKVTSSNTEPGTSCLLLQSLPGWVNLTLACKSETFRSLHKFKFCWFWQND